MDSAEALGYDSDTINIPRKRTDHKTPFNVNTPSTFYKILNCLLRSVTHIAPRVGYHKVHFYLPQLSKGVQCKTTDFFGGAGRRLPFGTCRTGELPFLL